MEKIENYLSDIVFVEVILKIQISFAIVSHILKGKSYEINLHCII